MPRSPFGMMASPNSSPFAFTIESSLAPKTVVLGRFLEGPELWGRIVASPVTHALLATAWGFSLARDIYWRPRHAWGLTVGLLAAMLAHGLYDLFVLSPGAGRLLAAGVILFLWSAFLLAVVRMPRCSREQPCDAARE